MRRLSGSALQGQPHHSLNLRITDLARRPGARFIQQPVQPPLHKALAPFADRLVGQPELLRHGRVGLARRALQNNARALGQRLRTLGRRAQRSSVSRSATVRLNGALGLPVRICVSPPLQETLTDYILFTAFTTQDTSLSKGTGA